MSWRLQGIGASPGRVRGRVRHVHPEIPRVPHRTIGPEDVPDELERFEEARAGAVEDTRELERRTRERLGEIEAKIFEPQLLMLEDPDLVEGTESYIRDNYLAAERAFDWKLLEIRSQFVDSGHALVTERLADLRDIRSRVLKRLLPDPGPQADAPAPGESAVLAFEELPPSLTVGLDRDSTLGLITAAGSRASHSALLARSLGIPAVLGVGDRLDDIRDGVEVILNGSTGRMLVDPTPDEVENFENSLQVSTARRERLRELASAPARSADDEDVVLQVNLDQPDEVREARTSRPEGVGLFRSEFLVIGRRRIPSEEEQYEAYRRVVEAFPEHEVTLRTFDIGGDKFPIFLSMPPEENPYLGWRAIRVCLDRPELFRNQIRAALRASAHGDLRLLLPFVVSTDEVRRTRDVIREVRRSLDGVEEVPLGVMVETPAAAETVDLLAPHVEFLSLGTNDLTQYVLAVDRGNARLARYYDPLHPALFRMYRRLHDRAADHGLEVSVCGNLATEPTGLAALLGLGYRKFSLPPASLLEAKEWVRSMDVGELAEICRGLGEAESGDEIRAPLRLYLEAAVPSEAMPAVRLS